MQPADLKWKYLDKIIASKAEVILKDIMPIPKGEVSILAAKGGVGKSFLSIQLAMQYANRHNKKAGLWLSEDSESQVKFRADLISKRLGILFPIDGVATITVDPQPFLIKNEHRMFVPNYEALDTFIEWATMTGVEFLIIDPLINFYGGDENDNVQARAFMSPFVKWAHSTGITILFVHHSAKGSTGARGAADFVNGVKCVYTIALPTDEKDEVDMDMAKAGFRTIEIIKDNLYMSEYLPEDGASTIKVMPSKKQEHKVEEVVYDMPKL